MRREEEEWRTFIWVVGFFCSLLLLVRGPWPDGKVANRESIPFSLSKRTQELNLN
uniref:Uncharacterized protein n=1 Tax=Arundo donax TaxID=35708 RepID=A0A0A9HAC1_ARUDO